MKRKLAIIGASYLQKPLVEKAREMGLETHIFAWEEGAVCKNIGDYFYPISIREIDTILEQCKKIKPTGIVSIGSDLAMIAVNTIAHELGLIGNSIESTELSTNKYVMRLCLSDAGIECPKYVKYSKELYEDNLKGMHFPLIVKPVDRSGSRGVNLVKNQNDLESAVKEAENESLSDEVIIEEFIEGRELSVETISWQGKHYILQYTDKITTGAPHFIEMAHHQPALLTAEEKEQINTLVLKGLNALNINYGASHTEIKINAKGDIRIIEIGARMGGDCIGSDLVKLSTGYDFVQSVIEIATGKFNRPQLKENNYAGIHYIFPKPGILEGVIFKGDSYVVNHEILSKMQDFIPEIKDSSQRPAYYIYKSDHRIEFDPEQLILITEAKNDNTF